MFHLLLMSSFVLTASLCANYQDDFQLQDDFLAGDVSPEQDGASSMYSNWDDVISDDSDVDDPESYGESDDDIIIDDDEDTNENEGVPDDADDEDVNN